MNKLGKAISNARDVLEEATRTENSVCYVTSEDKEWIEMAIKALKQQSTLDKIRDEILEEKECAYADFERYKIDYLGVDAEYVEDELPQDDFRYGMERVIEIIDKYRK